MKSKKIIDQWFECKDCGDVIRNLAHAINHSKKCGHRIYGNITTEWKISYKKTKVR